MPAGRPQIIDQNTLQILEGAFADGATDKLACFLANISESTLYNYQEKHPELVERKAYLKKQTKYQAKKNIRQAIKEGDKDISKWYLERRDKDFKPKSDITTDDEPLQPVLVKFIDKDESDTNNRDTN